MLRLMVNFARLAAIAAMLLPMGLSAQAARETVKRPLTAPNRAPTPTPTPPPAPPVPYQTLASAPVPDVPGSTEALVVEGDTAAILITRGSADKRFLTIDSVPTLLGLLADRRLMPLWPALIDWAGPGAEGLRDRQIESARRALAGGRPLYPQNTAASASRPKARALLHLASSLDRGGKRDEALALLMANRSAAPGKADADQFEWVAMTIRISGIYSEAGDFDHALATLRDAEAAMAGEQFYSINFRINGAAYLAEKGRHAEALAMIDVALAQFKAANAGHGNGDRVPGAGREFSWVRACALRGLGRVDEADAEAAQMLADANPTDNQFVLKPTTQIAVRYARCIDDPQLAARLLASEVASESTSATAFFLLQPARAGVPGDNGFFARVRQEPTMVAALGDRFRALPEAFVPALNRWYPTTGAPTPTAH